MANEFTTFDAYKVTGASVNWRNKSQGAPQAPAVPFGCTGKLELETEMKTVIKKCEGDEVLHKDIPTKINGTWTGHTPVENLRQVFGLETKELKEGVYAYGTSSRQGGGVLGFEVLDLDETMKMFLAFTNIEFTGGLKWSLENGAEEIAEIELTFTAMKDDNNRLLYQALESDLKDEDVKTKWLTNFTPDLVKEVATEEGLG